MDKACRPISSNSRRLRDGRRLLIVTASSGGAAPRLRGSQERPRQPDPVSTGVGTGEFSCGPSFPFPPWRAYRLRRPRRGQRPHARVSRRPHDLPAGPQRRRQDLPAALAGRPPARYGAYAGRGLHGPVGSAAALAVGPRQCPAGLSPARRRRRAACRRTARTGPSRRGWIERPSRRPARMSCPAGCASVRRLHGRSARIGPWS